MQSENFDKRIREAADHHHPNYDENAWAKMEALLDEHMPTKEKRKRRILFFFLLFLFAGGASWLLITRPWEDPALFSNAEVRKEAVKENPSPNNSGSNQQGQVPSGSRTDQHKAESTNSPVENSDNSVTSDATLPNEVIVAQPSVDSRKEEKGIKTGPALQEGIAAGPDRPGQELNKSRQGKQPPVGVKTGTGRNTATRDIKKRTPGEDDGQSQKARARREDPQGKLPAAAEKEQSVTRKSDPSHTQPSQVTEENRNEIVRGDDSLSSNNPSIADVRKEVKNVQQEVKNGENEENEEKNKENKEEQKAEEVAPADAETTAAKKSGKKEKQPGSFFISGSVAPDLSMVGMNHPGKTQLVTGIGIGYTYRDRLTIRTGFYAGNKVYDARPSDYKPESPPPNPDYLYRIDADCKVFEIPISLSYNLLRSPKYKVFAGAGISSFIMKRESYDYVYKYPGSDDEHIYNWTIRDQNKHPFSVLTFSAGYERMFGKRLSVAAEPYLKLPLAGVGLGKVRLQSAGLMFSVNYRPFGSK